MTNCSCKARELWAGLLDLLLQSPELRRIEKLDQWRLEKDAPINFEDVEAPNQEPEEPAPEAGEDAPKEEAPQENAGSDVADDFFADLGDIDAPKEQ